MSAITTTIIAALAWVVDMASVIRGPGKQIDWDLVSDKYLRGAQTLTVGTGGIALGATSLPVEALGAPLKSGTALNFGSKSDVVVTASAALAAATSIGVTALTGPIPSGTTLDFGTNKFARLTANAAAGATSITVAAIPTALAGGETATYQGGSKELIVAADAAAGATTVTVHDAPFALIAGETATFTNLAGLTNLNPGAKFIPGGTVMCTIAASKKMVPRGDHPGSEPADAILETDASSDSRTASLTGYGRIRGANLFENLLPDAIANGGTLPSAYKTELAANAGTFVYNVSHDSRGD